MFGFVLQALREIAKERQRQTAIGELNKLSDHLLADIGFRRDQLPAFVLELADEEERGALAPVFRPELQPCG